MKDASGLVRTWLYGVLNGTVTYNAVTVPVYSFPPKDAAMPYMLIAEQSTGSELDESTKDCYIAPYYVTLEIYASEEVNDASYVPVNTIADSALQLIRTRTMPTISGYNVISRIYEGGVTDRFDLGNKIVIFKSMNFKLIIEET